MNDEVKELVKKWCDRKLTQEDIPKLLYYYAKDVKHQEVSAELIPVPTTESYSSEPGTIRLTSTSLKNFIEINTGTVSEDELPPVYDPTEEQ